MPMVIDVHPSLNLVSYDSREVAAGELVPVLHPDELGRAARLRGKPGIEVTTLEPNEMTKHNKTFSYCFPLSKDVFERPDQRHGTSSHLLGDLGTMLKHFVTQRSS